MKRLKALLGAVSEATAFWGMHTGGGSCNNRGCRKQSKQPAGWYCLGWGYGNRYYFNSSSQSSDKYVENGNDD